MSAANWGIFWGGGGAKSFFRGRNVHQENGSASRVFLYRGRAKPYIRTDFLTLGPISRIPPKPTLCATFGLLCFFGGFCSCVSPGRGKSGF